MDTLNVSEEAVDGVVNSLMSGNWKTAAIWVAVGLVGVAVVWFAKKKGLTITKG